MKKTALVPFSVALLITFALATVAHAQGDVRRRTIAITYFKDPVTVKLAGTTLLPKAHGEATVERWRKRNESEIDITIENLVPAYTFGADYTTYVLWAITPAGQIDNLGEFRLSGSTARLQQLHRRLVVIALGDFGHGRVFVEVAGVAREIDFRGLHLNFRRRRREVFHHHLALRQLDQIMRLGGDDHRKRLVGRRRFQTRRPSRQPELAEIINLPGGRDGP